LDHFPLVYFSDFLVGILFDAITTAIVFLPLVAIEMFPNKWRGKRFYQWILMAGFQVILFLTTLINLIDIEYFKHTSSRSTASLIKMLGFGDDLRQQLPSFLKDYWYLFIILILFQVLGIWLYLRINRIADDSSKVSWFKQILFFPLTAAIFVLVGRGLYALAEWGYVSGVVKDVIVKVLNKYGPMTREEIFDKVMKERYVKENTILVNLQNSSVFKKDSSGKYHVITEK
jgi:hypothetical protein